MFRRIVDRYCDRIASLPEKVTIWQTFPTREWILIFFHDLPGDSYQAHSRGSFCIYRFILHRAGTDAGDVSNKIHVQ